MENTSVWLVKAEEDLQGEYGNEGDVMDVAEESVADITRFICITSQQFFFY